MADLTKKQKAERWLRYKVCFWAYAYELRDYSIVSDNDFDRACLDVKPHISTNDETLDVFFLTEFSPCTGSWIHRYPYIDNLKKVFDALYGEKADA